MTIFLLFLRANNALKTKEHQRLKGIALRLSIQAKALTLFIKPFQNLFSHDLSFGAKQII